MKIRVYSDIHWEFDHSVGEPFWEPPVGPEDKDTYLILAGDLWYGNKSLEVIRRINDRFLKVILIFGNHDYWHHDFRKAFMDYKQELWDDDSLYNVVLLDDLTYEIDDYVFFGSTLWTSMDRQSPIVMAAAPSIMVPDFKFIKNFDANVWVNAHSRSVNYIERAIKHNPDKKVIVISHHLPSFNSVHKKFRDGSIMNHYFYSYLDNKFFHNDNLKLWVHGHTHNSFDYMLGNTRVYCNPRGYNDENEYIRHEVIDI